MKKIKEIHNRKSLNEGRNFGIGFAVLKPNSNKTKYTTLNAFTACKDYLNDFSYVEHEKKEIGSIHGYNHKLYNCFDRKRFFYLGVNTLNYHNGNSWKPKKEATKILIENTENLLSLINLVELKLKLRSKTTLEIDEDALILRVPIYWSKSTALISAYTLMIRCFFNVDDVDESNIDDILSNHTVFINGDSMYKKNIKTIYNNPQLKYDKVDYDFLSVKDKRTIHNFGISGYLSHNLIKSQLKT